MKFRLLIIICVVCCGGFSAVAQDTLFVRFSPTSEVMNLGTPGNRKTLDHLAGYISSNRQALLRGRLCIRIFAYYEDTHITNREGIKRASMQADFVRKQVMIENNIGSECFLTSLRVLEPGKPAGIVVTYMDVKEGYKEPIKPAHPRYTRSTVGSGSAVGYYLGKEVHGTRAANPRKKKPRAGKVQSTHARDKNATARSTTAKRKKTRTATSGEEMAQGNVVQVNVKWEDTPSGKKAKNTKAKTTRKNSGRSTTSRAASDAYRKSPSYYAYMPKEKQKRRKKKRGEEEEENRLREASYSVSFSVAKDSSYDSSEYDRRLAAYQDSLALFQQQQAAMSSIPPGSDDYINPYWNTMANATKWKQGIENLAIKTNMLVNGAGVANIGAEYMLAAKASVDLSFYFSPYTISPRYNVRVLALQPELRYWLVGYPGSKHFVGPHGLIGWYNVAVGSQWRYQSPRNSPAIGGGLTYGYVHNFNRRLGMEFVVGVGYVRMIHDKFYHVEDGMKVQAAATRHYVGPTKLGISLTYRFGQ